jgi:hypothetical protein
LADAHHHYIVGHSRRFGGGFAVECSDHNTGYAIPSRRPRNQLWVSPTASDEKK